MVHNTRCLTTALISFWVLQLAGEDMQFDTARIEGMHDADQMTEITSETVELSDDGRVAGLEPASLWLNRAVDIRAGRREQCRA
jgi:hypothetical protein